MLHPKVLDATFRDESLASACSRLSSDAVAAARDGAACLLVDDAATAEERLPLPSLLAVAAVHRALVEAGLRTSTSLVVASDEPREVHHFACLLGYGADAVCPRLALETVADLGAQDKLGGATPEEAQRSFRRAVEGGVLKVMSKMGISDVDSYRGAEVFDAIGLADDVLGECFPHTPATIGPVGFAELERDVRARHEAARAEARSSRTPGTSSSARAASAMRRTRTSSPRCSEAAAHKLRAAVNGTGWEDYERFAQLVNDREPLELRDLLVLASAVEPVPLDEVEPAESILARFSSGGMSLGSLSAEAHETVAIAFNRLGARSNSGEGGEDPARFGDERNSRIKQIASARFGVTARYAVSADELQIKIAQGSKPGEGGQLPAHKVSEEIARLRHTQPGIELISPPPHHDIYSIEDLAQLVFDLRQVSPRADVSVKLVSEAGVGLVAAGVVKALADVVHVAGADGGTGASPLASIKNAGAPWELGLAETQRTLVERRPARSRRLRVDGGLKTGRDVVVAALLGADEVSFGTAVLLAEGCLLVRSCHLDTCPVGIATQRPELRAKFAATPEQVEAYLRSSRKRCAGYLAVLGLRRLEDAIGRTDLLRPREGAPLAVEELLGIGGGYVGEPQLAPSRRRARRAPGRRSQARARGGAPARSPLPDLQLRPRRRRAARRRDRVEVRRRGPAGSRARRLHRQRWAELRRLPHRRGRLALDGEANDYVGKSMSGGRIVVRPPAGDAGDPVLVGNTVLYGATGGELFVAGRAGERFAVRNSGASAVVEGVGDNACEYMTGGTVVVLGEVGRNVGAGMSGGELYVFDTKRLERRSNEDVVLRPATAAELLGVRELVERHERSTRSPRSADVLARWDELAPRFVRVAPRTAVAETAQGTG